MRFTAPGSTSRTCSSTTGSLVARLTDAKFVRGGQVEAFPQDSHEVDLPASGDGPESADLTGCGGTGAGLVRELGRRDKRDRGADDGRTGADRDELLRLRDFWAITGQPGDLVLHGLLARPVGPVNDDLKALVVLEEAGVEFGLDSAGGRGVGEAG